MRATRLNPPIDSDEVIMSIEAYAGKVRAMSTLDYYLDLIRDTHRHLAREIISAHFATWRECRIAAAPAFLQKEQLLTEFIEYLK